MSNDTDWGAVRDALQAGYGDATQTVLDDEVAGSVIGTLRDRGWASLPEVAAIILAAGGEVRINDRDFMRALDGARNGDLVVTVREDYATRERVLRVERRP